MNAKRIPEKTNDQTASKRVRKAFDEVRSIHNTYILIVIVIVKFHKNLSESVLLLVKAGRYECLGLRIE